MYKLTLTKLDKNPDYDEALKEFRAHQNRYGSSYGEGNEPSPYIHSKALEVTLHDHEFQAVKKAVLETM